MYSWENFVLSKYSRKQVLKLQAGDNYKLFYKKR